MTEQTISQSRRETLARQVKALFAKSASASETGNEAEAEACWAKAQELLTKYQIDEELARISETKEKASKPTSERFYLKEGAYLKSRAQLATMISRAMGLINRIATDGSFVVFYGFEEDIRAAWEMFELIEPQMVAACDRRIREGKHHEAYLHAKTYRINYFNGYAVRIQQRLWVARQEAAEQVVLAEGSGPEQTGRVTGALVLVGRTDEVKSYYEGLFPKKTNKDGSVSKRQPGQWGGPKASRRSATASAQGQRDGDKARLRKDSTLASRRSIR